jgi:hypothetical protein
MRSPYRLAALAAAAGLIAIPLSAQAASQPGTSGNWEATIQGYCIAAPPPVSAKLLPVRVPTVAPRTSGAQATLVPQVCYPTEYVYVNTSVTGRRLDVRTSSPTNFHLVNGNEIQQAGTNLCWTLNASKGWMDEHVNCTVPNPSWQAMTFGSNGLIVSDYNLECVVDNGVYLQWQTCDGNNRDQQWDWIQH